MDGANPRKLEPDKRPTPSSRFTDAQREARLHFPWERGRPARKTAAQTRRASTHPFPRRRPVPVHSLAFTPSFPPFHLVIPALPPRHSRESGNPEGCNQARHPKSSTNTNQRIPSPFMGEG